MLKHHNIINTRSLNDKLQPGCDTLGMFIEINSTLLMFVKQQALHTTRDLPNISGFFSFSYRLGH